MGLPHFRAAVVLIKPPIITGSQLCLNRCGYLYGYHVLFKSNIERVKKEKEVRKKMIVVRMNPTEYDNLQKLYSKSTCRQLSEYLRKVALQKPITIKYRNEGADEILSALLKIKTELNAIGNNFNQAVHKLHILDQIPEFRSWLMLYETTRQSIEKKLAETKEQMVQIYHQWSPK